MANNFDTKKLLEESAKARFEKLDNDRATVIDTARDCAKLTLPYVLPPQGHKETDRLANPYQNTGARLVNGLASKITFTLLPPNNPFFRMFLTEEVRNQLEGATNQDGTNQLSQAENVAVRIENDAQKIVAKQALIVPINEAMKSLLITGNALLVKVKPKTSIDKGLKNYRLDNYVVKRDFRGNLLEVITKEEVSPFSLPEAIVEQLKIDINDSNTPEVGIYTRAVFREGKWYEYQYVDDVLVDGSLATYSPDVFPYMALRTTAVNGHDYGLGIVTQHLGDFISLEACNQLLFEASAVAGRVIFGKKPGSVIDIDEVNNASNGDIVEADFDSDLTVLRVDKQHDLSQVAELKREIERRLELVFLSANAAVRPSERTTLGEIRYLAKDLEQAQGGLYSLLSQELQQPLARLVLKEMNVDMQGFDFVPVTGVEALGRNNDLDKLRQFSAILQETPVLQQAIGQYFNVSNYVDDVTTASSLPQGRYIKTPQQIQAEQQQAMANQVAQQGIASAAQTAGQSAGQQFVGGA